MGVCDVGARYHRGVVKEVAGSVPFGTPMTATKLVHRLEWAARMVGAGTMPAEAAIQQIVVDLTAHGRTRAADAVLVIAAGVAGRVRGGDESGGESA